MISLIAAMDVNHVIGIENTIPWHLPSDRAWFKNNTLYKPVIMGRLTWESIGKKPLQNRINIIISNNHLYKIYEKKYMNQVKLVKSIDTAISSCKNATEIMIIGGEQIYSQFLPKADRLYLTYIDIKVKGDTYFPYYNLKEWKVIFNASHTVNQKNPYNYFFKILERKR